jgi:hypothetical protein
MAIIKAVRNECFCMPLFIFCPYSVYGILPTETKEWLLKIIQSSIQSSSVDIGMND